MSNPSKAKGTRYETALVDTINDWIGDQSACERKVQKGSRDQGDIRLRYRDMEVAIEAKWSKSAPNKALEDEFKRQTLRERDHAGADCGVLIVNRYRQSIMRTDVYMTQLTLATLRGWDVEDVEDEHSWVRASLLDFLWTLYGAPAWEDRRD